MDPQKDARFLLLVYLPLPYVEKTHTFFAGFWRISGGKVSFAVEIFRLALNTLDK